MEAPVRVEVDGEVFDVVGAGADNPGAYHYTWVSGRDPEYGFTSAWSDRRTPTTAEHLESIRDFLARIDPATGYLAD